jgi:hypothetical protein
MGIGPNTTAPIEVTPTTLPDQLYAFMRQATLVIGGFMTILALLKTKDIGGILDFVRSNDFITAVVGLATLAALIYGNLKTKWRKMQLIKAASSAHDSVARVVSK